LPKLLPALDSAMWQARCMGHVIARRLSTDSLWMPPAEAKDAMKLRLAAAQQAAATPPSLQGGFSFVILKSHEHTTCRCAAPPGQ